MNSIVSFEWKMWKLRVKSKKWFDNHCHVVKEYFQHYNSVHPDHYNNTIKEED